MLTWQDIITFTHQGNPQPDTVVRKSDVQHCLHCHRLDGYIAEPNNVMDWLHQVPNPDGSDSGFADFMTNVDVLVMGRNLS